MRLCRSLVRADTPIGPALRCYSRCVDLRFLCTPRNERTDCVSQGGSFLYVATVLQPALAHSHASGSEEVGGRTRLLLTIAGMLTPYVIASVLGDDHGHA